MKRLERQLGVNLFNRSPKKIELSEAGHEFLQNCRSVLEARDLACTLAQNKEHNVSGELTISVGSEFGSSLICPFIINMKQHYPLVTFKVPVRADRKPFRMEPDIDCYISTGQLPAPNLEHHLLGKFTFRLYASPDYLENHGVPDQIMDIEQHKLIASIKNGQTEHWQLQNKKRTAEICPESGIMSDSYWMTKYFAVDGMGLAYLPDFFVNNELDEQLLVPVLPSWRSAPIPLYLMYPPQNRNNRKIRFFAESCVAAFSKLTRSTPPYRIVV